MLKLRADQLVILGFTDAELTQLASGLPILVNGTDIGLPPKIAILHGRDDHAIVANLRGMGLDLAPLQPDGVKDGREVSYGIQAKSQVKRVIMRLLERALGLERIETSSCGHCGELANAGAALTEASRNSPNQPGDWAICSHCGGVNRIDSTLKLRKASPEEIATLGPGERRLLELASEHVRTNRLRRTGEERGQA